jgi:hypothetical protein
VTVAAMTIGDRPRPDSWLCELTSQEGPVESPSALQVDSATVGGNASTSGSRPVPEARASNQGFLPIDLEKYLALLDWTGREFRASKRGVIPDHLAPILERLGLIGEGWIETVRQFGRWFKTAVGRRDSLVALAVGRKRAWLQGQKAAALAFR